MFFGDGLIVLPGRNFARFILTCYILFCLVIRTIYQAKLFELMHEEIRPPDAETIEELFSRNFSLGVADYMRLQGVTSDEFSDMKDIQK